MPPLFGFCLRRKKAELADLLAMRDGFEPSGQPPAPTDPSLAGLEVMGPAALGPGFRWRGLHLQWDGELYNKRGLARSLDLEPEVSEPLLILTGWQAEGARFLRRLNGPFALALWDIQHGTWVIARGMQGLKPLFYYESPEGFAFGRNLPGLFSCPWVIRKPNWARIPEYVVFNHVAGGETLFAGVRELLPGEMLMGDYRDARPPAKTRFHTHWPSKRRAGGQAPPSEIQARLRASIARLWAAGPGKETALFLSGGVDSTLIAEVLHEIAGGEALPCLTVTCPGFRHDESAYARRVRNALGYPGREIRLEPDLFAETLMEIIRATLLPLTSTNQVPWWILSREAKRLGRCTVFSGEGADGWMSGGLYDEERASIQRKIRSDPDRAAFEIVFCRTHTLNDPGLVRRIFRIPLDASPRLRLWRELTAEAGHLPLDELEVLYHVRTAGNRLLTRADLASALHGIRLRLPYLESGWIRWIRSIPFAARNADGIRKRPLKALCAERWGEAFAYREKVGFLFPLRTWIRDGGAPALEMWRAILRDLGARGRDIYRKHALERELRDRLDGRQRPADWLLWSLVNLELWLGEIGW